ncbi:MAG TPA: DUF6285 domain-containing protein [Ilumatobacteraceae bacterium]
MQQPPTAADLLDTVASVLADEIVPALSGPAQHHARVAASLVGIVGRELRLGPDAAERERTALLSVLGDDDVPLPELRARLAAELRAGMADDAERHARIWSMLMASVRDDLAIAKPDHDSWDGD